MTDGPVELSMVDAVVTICLCGTEKRNALTPTLVEGVQAGLAEAAQSAEVKAVVVTHRGPAFCSGLDLSEAYQHGMELGAARMLALFEAVLNLPVPVIAQVDGQVRAGGMGLVAVCDITIAGPDAGFAFTEARLGLAPGVVALATLPTMSDAAASLYMLTGRPFDAEQARQLGLVTMAVPDTAAALAEVLGDLRRSSRQGLQGTKSLLTAATRAQIAVHGDQAVATSARLFGSAEARRHMADFLNRTRT